MATSAQEKLERLFRDLGGVELAARVGLSVKQIRRHRDGEVMPTAKAVALYEGVGITPADWLGAAPTAKGNRRKCRLPTSPLLATLAELDASLAGELDPRDRIARLGQKLQIAKELAKQSDPLLIWHWRYLVAWRESYTDTLTPWPEYRERVDAAFAATIAAEQKEEETRGKDPWALLDAVLQTVGSLLAGELAETDRTAALSLKRLASVATGNVLANPKGASERRALAMQARIDAALDGAPPAAILAVAKFLGVDFRRPDADLEKRWETLLAEPPSERSCIGLADVAYRVWQADPTDLRFDAVRERVNRLPEHCRAGAVRALDTCLANLQTPLERLVRQWAALWARPLDKHTTLLLGDIAKQIGKLDAADGANKRKALAARASSDPELRKLL